MVISGRLRGGGAGFIAEGPVVPESSRATSSSRDIPKGRDWREVLASVFAVVPESSRAFNGYSEGKSGPRAVSSRCRFVAEGQSRGGRGEASSGIPKGNYCQGSSPAGPNALPLIEGSLEGFRRPRMLVVFQQLDVDSHQLDVLGFPRWASTTESELPQVRRRLK